MCHIPNLNRNLPSAYMSHIPRCHTALGTQVFSHYLGRMSTCHHFYLRPIASLQMFHELSHAICKSMT